MPKPLSLQIEPNQKRELERVRDHHPKPYVRERAAALLKIAAGKSARQVALDGLLKTRDPDSVYSWFHRYRTEGVKGLIIKPGRGRKPAFSPSALDQGQRQPSDPERGPPRAAAVWPRTKPVDFEGLGP